MFVGPICENPEGPLFLPEFVGPIRRIALIIACVCLCVCVCLSVVHPSSAQVLQSILMKRGHMDHWGT